VKERKREESAGKSSTEGSNGGGLQEMQNQTEEEGDWLFRGNRRPRSKGKRIGPAERVTIGPRKKVAGWKKACE